MYQKWRDLTFLHFAAEPEVIQKLIPPELTIDTFPDESGKEMAWIGLVPFWMTDIRPRGLPSIPQFSTFPETNVRTYVHRKGRDPGVWFFSLDAANRIACSWAIQFFGLPYHWSNMNVERSNGSVNYRCSRRLRPQTICNAMFDTLTALPLPQSGSFEFFLIERYLLYAKRDGRLFTGIVHHKPYPLQSSRLRELDQNLIEANGIQTGNWAHCVFSPGVDVEVFGLREVRS